MKLSEDDAIAIKTTNLTKVFPGGVKAVDGLTLEIPRGQVFGFLGPNGAGKTTSIRMMTGLLRPTSGEVIINGQPVDKVTGETKRRTGLCPQEIVLWDLLTCMENLTLIARMYNVPGKQARKRAEDLLEALQLTEKRNALSNSLSGGMKRRLNVAMAMVHDPDIVILDEPTAGLDPQSRLVVTEYIDRIKKENKTIILTTHLMEIADQVSDLVAIIDHGKLLKLDTPENLKNQVGEGDVMDMALADEGLNQTAMEVLGKVEGVEETSELRGRVVVRALDVARRLPDIFEALDRANVRVSDVSLRRNTLEDVFISLTGRKLRE